MFTTCPKCALTLAVTAADLRAGQGYVRCGRCANVFNALLGLAEESTGAAVPAPAATRDSGGQGASVAQARTATREAEPGSAPAPAPGSAPAPAGAAAPVPDPAAPEPAPTAQPEPPRTPSPPALHVVESPLRQPATSQSTEVTESRGTGTFETIVLEGDTFLQTEEMVTEETFDDEVAAVSRRIAAAHDVEEQDEEIIDFSDDPMPLAAAPAPPAPAAAMPWRGADRPRARRQAGPAAAPGAQSPPAENADIGPLLPARARVGWKTITGITLCALLVAAQVLHHWRNDLATHQALAGPLNRFYSALHQPLAPNWNLAAYDVRQLGASSDAADQRIVRVRLSLSNHAPVPQAVPLLRITLLDRYGKRISAGELAPAQYLPQALRTRQLLDAEQRIDTEVAVPDPTQQASSFELDVCVAAPGGGLRCAGDSAVLAANGVVS